MRLYKIKAKKFPCGHKSDDAYFIIDSYKNNFVIYQDFGKHKDGFPPQHSHLNIIKGYPNIEMIKDVLIKNDLIEPGEKFIIL